MLLRYYNRFDGQPLVATIRGKRIRVGSRKDNDIVLNSPYVDPCAIVLTCTNNQWNIEAVGMNGCQLQDQWLYAGQASSWDTTTAISLFPFFLQLQANSVPEPANRVRFGVQAHDLVKAVHLDLVQQLHLNGSAESVPETAEELLLVERMIESSASHHGMTHTASVDVVSELAGSCIRDEILNSLLENTGSDSHSVLAQRAYWCQLATAVPEREDDLSRWKVGLTGRIFGTISSNNVGERLELVDDKFWSHWTAVRNSMSRSQREYLAMRQVKKQVKDTLYGFGPLEDLLRLPTISEIMVNASDEIFVEKGGILQNSGRQFVSDEVTQTVIERIVGRVGRRIDTAQPMVDARLPDGSRVNAVIPPLAVKGPCLTVRKFSRKSFTMDTLVHHNSLTSQVRVFLEACVRSKRSILVSGGTGSGKTTLLNCLSQAIPLRERIICIEDTHELRLEHPHVLFVECRDANNEGKGRVTIRDLLRNSLRQRPDRLIVGECRGDEALDMLQAMNTGHDGSLTTIHANSPADSLRRLEVLVRESGLPPDAVRQQIMSAIDIVVQLIREPTGRRMVSQVDEVVGIDPQSTTIRLRPIFRLLYDPRDQQQTLRPTGSLPSFASELIRDGHLQLEMFLHGTTSTGVTSVATN